MPNGFMEVLTMSFKNVLFKLEALYTAIKHDTSSMRHKIYGRRSHTSAVAS